MSTTKKCYGSFFFLTVVVAFLLELAIPIIMYLHYTSITNNVNETMPIPCYCGNSSAIEYTSYTAQELVNDNLQLFMCIAGAATLLIGFLLFVCGKLACLFEAPEYREQSLRERYFLEQMDKKAVNAQLIQMRAEVSKPTLPEGIYRA